MSGIDVLEMRIPEYHDTARANCVPLGCAVEKTAYIKDRYNIIAKMDDEIESLKKTISTTSAEKNYIYQNAVKRLKKCQEIKQNCESSIRLIEKQLGIGCSSNVKVR